MVGTVAVHSCINICTLYIVLIVVLTGNTHYERGNLKTVAEISIFYVYINKSSARWLHKN